MRAILIALATAAVAAAAATPATAQGQNSRWCADYGRGYYNCGFSTYEQCRATIAGFNRGSCYPNPQYGGERRYR